MFATETETTERGVAAMGDEKQPAAPRGVVLGPPIPGHPGVSIGNTTMDAVDLTTFRRQIGAFLDDVARGRTIALTRKGTVLAVVSPPPGVTRKLRVTEEELEAILSDAE